MLVKNPSHRKNINSNQKRLLKLIFKYRFVSVPLLSEYLHKDKSTVYEQLQVLMSQDFLLKRYDRSYRLPAKPASYALAAKGINYLRDNVDLSRTALSNMYKNKTASEALIEQSLNTLKFCLQLGKQYPDTFELYTKSLMKDCAQYILPLPDLHLQRKNNRSNRPDYLLDIIEAGTFSWVLRKRLQAHQEHYEEYAAQWSDNYPTLLFICGNQSTERRLHDSYNHTYCEIDMMTTTVERLTSSTTKNDTKIWIASMWDVDWDEEVVFKAL